jgi:prevent-host-death family protein
MVTVGIRELKEQASHLLRRVREEGETIEITYHGQAIARLVPIKPVTPVETALVLRELDDLIYEISNHMPPVVDVQELMNDIRREL